MILQFLLRIRMKIKISSEIKPPLFKDLVFGIFQELQLDILKWQTSNSEPGTDPTWGTTHYFSLLRK